MDQSLFSWHLQALFEEADPLEVLHLSVEFMLEDLTFWGFHNWRYPKMDGLFKGLRPTAGQGHLSVKGHKYVINS